MNNLEMFNDMVSEFTNKLGSLEEIYHVGTSGKIYKKNGNSIMIDESMNKEISPETIDYLKKKLKIVDTVKSRNIKEYRTGADKIIDPEQVSYGYQLIITVNGRLFFEYSGTTDDFKYTCNPERDRKNLEKIIEIKKTAYIKLLINTFINIYMKKYSTNISNEINIPSNIFDSEVAYGGKK